MSMISSVNHSSTGYAASIPVEKADTPANSFAQTLAAAQAPKSWLTSAGASESSRPNIKEFMDRCSAEFLDASELIYGVVGSNTDVRDWSAIMASDDPVSAARQATAQMYGRTDTSIRTDASYLGASDTLAREGNYAVRLLKDKDKQVLDEGLKLIDAQGLILRDAGSDPQTIARNAWLFGFDTKPLAKLQTAAATISPDLASAVAQASVLAPAPYPPTASITPPTASVDDKLELRASNTESLALISALESATQSEPQVAAQTDAHATAPALAQLSQAPTTDEDLAEAIAQATSSGLAYVDSASYLNSLFK